MLPFSCRSLSDGEQTEDPAVQDDEDEVHHPEDDADADEADDSRKDLNPRIHAVTGMIARMIDRTRGKPK